MDMGTQGKKGGPLATRRKVLLGIVAGVGASAALLPAAEAQQKGGSTASGPVLFKRTAETERYYKTLK
jgi:hypothetical protein